MAGDMLYSGEMFQQMIKKLDQTITALNNVNRSVAQGITALNVKAGADKVIVLNNTDFVHNVTASAQAKNILTVKSLCDGVIQYIGKIKVSQNGGYLSYSINGTRTNGDQINSTTYVEKMYSISVKKGDVITFDTVSFGTPSVITVEAGARIQYSLLDLVNENAFPVMS